MGKNKGWNSLTTVEKEKKSKIESEKIAEELDVLGQEDEKKAEKWVAEKVQEEEKKEKEERAISEWKINDQKGRIITYTDSLIAEIRRQISEYAVLKGYSIHITKTKKGILFSVRDTEGNWYSRGMTVSGIPKYDINGVDRMVIKCLDTIENIKKQTSSNNLILPPQ